MQALSFAVHIPLVCFGIAFPAMVLFVEWLLSAHGRSSSTVTLARRWTKVMVGAVRGRRRHRDDPQLRDGPALAELHRQLRQRLRARLRDRGLLVLPGGDLHRHLRLRLGRLSPRAALRQRHPDRARRLHRVADGDRGQRLDEPPDRLPAARRQASSTCIRCEALFGNSYFWHELVHMYLAGYIVTGFLRRGRLRGRAAARALGTLRAHRARDPARRRGARVAGAGARRRLERRARSRATQPTKLAAFEGLGADDDEARPMHLLGWYTDGRVEYGIPIPRLLSLLAYHDPNATVPASTRCRRTTVRRSTSCASPSRRWSGSARCSRCSRVAYLAVRFRRRRLPESPWFYRALVARRAALGRRADPRLGRRPRSAASRGSSTA